MHKILIASGSSGGHLLPALSYAEQLKSDAPCDIHFLLAKPKSWKTPEALQKYPVHWTGFFSFPRRSLKSWVLFPFKFTFYFLQIFSLLVREKFSLVVGFGSFASVPAVLSAWLLRIPSVIHEANFDFGKATKALVPFASRIGVTYQTPVTEGKPKFFLTGNPLRRSLVEKCEKTLYVPPKFTDKLSVLVIGGSQGARHLNRIVWESFRGLREDELSRYRLKQLTGKLNYEEMINLYESLPKNFDRTIIDFSENVADLYIESHWVIARSGAGSVSELAAFGRPSLLVPYPHAESHQKANARYLESRDAAEVIEEKDLTPEVLRGRLRLFRNEPERLKCMAENAKNTRILDAASRLSRISLELLRN